MAARSTSSSDDTASETGKAAISDRASPAAVGATAPRAACPDALIQLDERPSQRVCCWPANAFALGRLPGPAPRTGSPAIGWTANRIKASPLDRFVLRGRNRSEFGIGR